MHLALLLACSPAAPTSPIVDLPLAIHPLRSGVRDVDGRRAITDDELQTYVSGINTIYAPAQVRFVPRIEAQDAGDASAFHATKKPNEAVRPLVPVDAMAAPEALDLYVLRHIGHDKGGMYLCQVGTGNPGAAFISARSSRGEPTPVRKWAHELGHGLGLRHTPCKAEYATNLMMSGECPLSEVGRAQLTAPQIEQIRRQAAVGRPIPCGEPWIGP